jgi:proline iminopeptidase
MSQAPELPVETLGEGQHLPLHVGHQVWWCEGGDPQGLPVLIVHGGPGGRSRTEPLQWWAGQAVRWVCMDQRGCGRSLPRGGVEANTLAHLLEDIEILRRHLGLDRWAVAAGSWGAFVAVSYAARHPEAVSGLFLRSAFLGSREELHHYLAPWTDWIGTANLPAHLAVPDPGQLYRVLTGASQADTAFSLSQELQALGPWMQAFETVQSAPGGLTATRSPSAAPASRWSEEDVADWRVHSHYASQRWTTGEDAWDSAAQALRALDGPLSLVHGVNDAVCPVQTSARLAGLRPDARLVTVAGGGHRMGVNPMRDALITEARAWAQRVR